MTTPPTTTTTPRSGIGSGSGSGSGRDPFIFPREYHFPPFFTRQTNLATRHAQLAKWSALTLAYCAHHRLFRLSVSSCTVGDAPTTGAVPTDELFHNRKLNRRLGPADVREVFDFMRRDGRAEWVSESGRGGSGGAGAGAGAAGGPAGGGGGGGGGGAGGAGGPAGGGGGDVAWIYWKTPEEWARDIEDWVEGTAQKGTVLTLYELTQGEGTRGTAFHGLDPDLLHKSLHILVKRGKAQIFGQEDQQGVKFF